MIEIKSLRKEYVSEKTSLCALSDLSLSFPKVQFVSVLGPSGCGKTTLLNCLGGLDSFTSGDILIDGKSLRLMNEQELNAYRNNHIGFVFQNYYLIPQLTLLDNIKIALAVRDYSQSEIDRRAKEALKKVGLEDCANKKPNQISGGQAQRVAIARCIVTEPSVILADEPTGALDSQNSIVVMDLLKELSKDHLVIVVTHNEELAKQYSNRIIRLKDGCLVSDELCGEDQESVTAKKKELKRSHLSLLMSTKLAAHNLFSRKAKTILTGIANSFGMIGIGFLLAINLGFRKYSINLSSASATSLPVVVTTYNRTSTTEKFSDKNASISYTDAKEIYPSVDLESQYSYSYNQFTPKYLSYLNSLKQQNLVRDYTMNYGNSYSYNLTTVFPKSIDEEHEGGYQAVNTTITSYNSYAYQANLPYNIFHVLYGDLNQYDVIAGTLPQNKEDLVLVVDQYNAVDFDILKALGFYNNYDTESQVQDKSLSTKVKPISFETVLQKEYKIFNNDEYYKDYESLEITDAMGNTRIIPRYQEPELTEDFYSKHGTTLKISAIIRPKSSSPLTILAPALCYLPALQDEYMPKNEESKIAQSIRKNLVFRRPDYLPSDQNVVLSFVNEVTTIIDDFINSGSSVLPTSRLNEVFYNYFSYYPVVARNYYYFGYSTFLSDARNHGASLVDEELLGKDLAQGSVLQEQFNKILVAANEGDNDKLYDLIISIIAYSNAYSEISSLIIFPVDLQSRALLLSKLDEFNNNVDKNQNMALSEDEKVFYVAANANSMLESVGEMISLVSIILIIFAVISLVVSSSMTALLTSNNVLERKKEIGLLRSLGSRKIDVIRIFETEAISVGFLSGVIGSLITFVLSFPINALINSYYPRYRVGEIVNFVWYHGVIVVAIGVFIAFVASLIPAIKASKQNPVDALRSD